MLRMQSRIPVDAPEVEFEGTIAFADFSNVVRFTGEEFHLEKAEFGIDRIELVDDRTKRRGVFGEDDMTN